jgi:ubiquinone/menaquinone biosynthesis C-methylase UbiE
MNAMCTQETKNASSNSYSMHYLKAMRRSIDLPSSKIKEWCIFSYLPLALFAIMLLHVCLVFYEGRKIRMPWFSWWPRKQQIPAVATSTAPRTVYVPGRETVMTGESHYVIPHDLREANRLDLQHYALKEHFGTNSFAPILNPKHILDVACGTGRWAMELAAQFPDAQVVGIDASLPIEVQEQRPPPTEYRFVQGNALEPLPFPDASFDYVHMRFMFSAMPAQKWPEVVHELARVTGPGGWVELVEANSPTNGGEALEQAGLWGSQMLATRGIDLAQTRNIGRYLAEAGLVAITERDGSLPVGSYGGRVGQIMGVDMITAYRLGGSAFVQALGLDQRLVEKTINQADADIYSGQYQAVLPIYIAFGQRSK